MEAQSFISNSYRNKRIAIKHKNNNKIIKKKIKKIMKKILKKMKNKKLLKNKANENLFFILVCHYFIFLY